MLKGILTIGKAEPEPELTCSPDPDDDPLGDVELTLGRTFTREQLGVFWAIAQHGAGGLAIPSDTDDVDGSPVEPIFHAIDLESMGLVCWSGRSDAAGDQVYVLTEEGRRVRRRIQRAYRDAGRALPCMEEAMALLGRMGLLEVPNA